MIIKNIINNLRRFAVSTFLNVVGLSIAIASAVILLVQVEYDFTYNDNIPGASRIYRLDSPSWGNLDGYQSVVPLPIGRKIGDGHPGVESYCVVSPFMSPNVFMTIREGEELAIKTKGLISTPSIDKVFSMEVLQGDFSRLEMPKTVAVCQSVADRHNLSVGDQIIFGDTLTIEAVFRDFEKRNDFHGFEFIYKGDIEKFMNRPGDWSFISYYKLSSEEHLESFYTHICRIFYDWMYAEDPNAESFESVMAEDRDAQNGFPRLVSLSESYFCPSKYYHGDTGNRTFTFVFLSIAVLLLVIAFINYFNFFMSLIPRRIRAVNTEKVFGASLIRLRGSFVLESLFLVSLAFFFATLLVEGARYTFIADYVSSSLLLSDHWALLGLLLIATLLLAVISSLYPAYFITSISPAMAIKGSFGNSAHGRRLRFFLLSLQFVISAVLISATMYINMQYDYMMHYDMGFNKENVLVTHLTSHIGSSQSRRQQLAETLCRHSQITDVTFTSEDFVADERMTWGRKVNGNQIYLECCKVSPNFLDFFEIPIVQGRNFTSTDLKHKAMIINETTWRNFGMPSGDSLNNIALSGYPIVGVCPDFQFKPLRNDCGDFAFIVNNSDFLGHVYFRTASDANLKEVIAYVQQSVKGLDKFRSREIKVWFFDDELQANYLAEQQVSRIISLFSIVSICISLLGVFGLVFFETQYRRREIAIRRVNGAGHREIIHLFGKTYALMVTICCLISIPITYVAMKIWLSSFAYSISLSPWVFVVSWIFILVITLLIVGWRCHNTLQEDPVNALHKE